MIVIDPNLIHSLHDRQPLVEVVMILTERDLRKQSLELLLCGQDADLIIVPREVTEEEKLLLDNVLFQRNGKILINK